MIRLLVLPVSLLLAMRVQAQVTDSTGAIQGTVWSAINQWPLEGALIDLKWPRYSALSNSLGHFRISGIRPGKYQLQILGFGYDRVDTSVVVAPGDTVQMDLILTAVCPFNAHEDVSNGEPKLLLVGSIAPLIIRGQERFEKKYGVRYYDFGDMPPADACISEYNRTIFDYLDKKYGTKWRREVRNDVELLTTQR